MDETSFIFWSKNTKVVAMKGSHNVWSKCISANFHLFVVACGSVLGHVIPSIYILPSSANFSQYHGLLLCLELVSLILTAARLTERRFCGGWKFFRTLSQTPFPAHFSCSLTVTYLILLSLWSKWENNWYSVRVFSCQRNTPCATTRYSRVLGFQEDNSCCGSYAHDGYR